MTIIIILALAGAVALLWARVDKLEQDVADLTGLLEELRNTRVPEPSIASDLGGIEAAQPTYPVAPEVEESPKPVEEPPSRDRETEFVEPVAPEPVAAKRIEPDETVSVEAQPYEPQSYEADSLSSTRSFSFDFEDIFGRRLPIWGGGFALAIAGIFLVRFSIEAGLLTPVVRVSLSFLFGLALLAGAEAAFRFEERVRDPRVRQSLAGAGLATLYGAFYLAGTAYGLIGAGAAFVGLAVVTAAAIVLSFRFGLPSAVIGLVGGFAAPLLVDSDSANIPLLSFYLALITGGLAWTGEAQERRWLGYAALAAGLGWGALMMFAGVSSGSDFAALGVYLIVLGTVLPAFLHAKGGPSLPKLAAGAVATLQMAVLVSDAGFSALTCGLYLLIGAALSALGWRYPALKLGTLVASGLGLWLLLIWPDPDAWAFAWVAAAQIAIFAGVPLAHQWLWRARLLDIAQLSAVSLIMGIVSYVRFGSWGELESEPLLAAAMAGLALLPAGSFALIWKRGEEDQTRQTILVLAPTALLVFAALLLITPAWIAPMMAMLVSAPLIGFCWRRDALSLTIAGWAGAAIALVTLIVTPGFVAELSQLGDAPEDVDAWRALLRWVSAALPFACMAFIGRNALTRGVGEAFAVALVYGVVAQILPSAPLAWIAALAAMALFVSQPDRIAAWTTAFVIAGLWSFVPLVEWVEAGSWAMFGDPFFVSAAIAPGDLALRVAPTAAALAVLVWKGQDRRTDFKAFVLLALGIIAGITLHSLYKQLFGINSLLQFEQNAMAERTIWQALLMLAAYGAFNALPKAVRQPVGFGLIAVALAHFGWFTLVMHNPLLAVQHVGPTSIANWLMPAYATAIGGIWLALTEWEESPPRVRQFANAATIVLISLLAYSLLRQVFSGTVLVAQGIGETESLLISLLGILLALGFLWWGSMRDERSWRVGSLVLMLVAVVKVFLIDAAGLQGLLRIVSFMALGFSLIGIGWVYSRQLSQRASQPV